MRFLYSLLGCLLVLCCAIVFALRRYLGFWCGSVRSGVTVTLCGLVSVEGGMAAVRFRACVLATKYEGQLYHSILLSMCRVPSLFCSLRESN